MVLLIRIDHEIRLQSIQATTSKRTTKAKEVSNKSGSQL
jgi:hypothetical protein